MDMDADFTVPASNLLCLQPLLVSDCFLLVLLIAGNKHFNLDKNEGSVSQRTKYNTVKAPLISQKCRLI